MYYEITIAGKKRKLPLYSVNDQLSIAAFILFGDVEMTLAAAKEMLAMAPEFDILITAEAKSIPLAYEMARQAGHNNYIIARKGEKVYMEDTVFTHVDSITTRKQQSLCLGKKEADLMKGKRVLIVDDVISTGGSLKAMELLVQQSGGTIVGKMAVLAEGEAGKRKDILFLEKLPLFHPDGTIKE